MLRFAWSPLAALALAACAGPAASDTSDGPEALTTPADSYNAMKLVRLGGGGRWRGADAAGVAHGGEWPV